MVLQKERTPVEVISFAAESQRGFYASGITPDFVKHYFSACLQAVNNLARSCKRSNKLPELIAYGRRASVQATFGACALGCWLWGLHE